MRLFVLLHLKKDGATADIFGGQLLKMSCQVLFDLSLGLCHEAQGDAVAGKASDHADGERSCVPEWVQSAGPVVEFGESCLAPGQMIGFLTTRLFQQVADGRVTRNHGLPVIQPLGRDFTGMVDPHQLCGLAAGRLGWHFACVTWRRTAGVGRGQEGTQSPVRRDNQLISKGSAGWHVRTVHRVRQGNVSR
jgi:hypothetical protein